MKRSSTVLAALLALLLVATNDAARHRKYRQTYQDIDSDDDDTSDVQITVFPSEKEVRDGRDVSFECRARTSDNSVYPTVRWARVGGPLPSSAHDSGGRLTINPVQLSDAGTYICVSDYNGNTVEARATLSVVSYGPQEVSNGLRQAGQCMADEKACGNNECVKNDYVCDGEPDCRDRSDEANCPAISRTCEPNEFKCNNNKCVQKMWLCDGDDDCGDNSDELNCNAKPSSSDCKPTEFQCHDRRQCVPSSFHCDGTNDCHDGSDEVGCVQPTVVDPPQTNLQVPRGTTFSLTCKAVAVPEPYINWRLNWGPVCEPPRCLQTSEGGYGTLTIHDAQPVDQGAYTCEAINVKGRVLATPDCIVRVVDDPRPQPPQPPTAPPQRASCDTRGAVTPYPNNYGTCECKSQVTGPNCDQCKPGAFHLSEKSPEGCLKCFCFGVSNDCRSSGHYRTKDRLMFAGDAEGVTISDIEERTIDRNTPFSFFKTGYLTFDGTTDGVAKYWRLPQRFLGDKVTAYGGKMEFEIEFSGSGHHSSEPMVVLKGNQNILVHRVRNQEHVLRSDSPVRITVETYETNYEQLNGAAATREDLLMVLADLDAFLIRATHVAHQTSTSLGDVSWEIAVDRYTPDGLALEVEQCVCPPGYLGTSCEDCAPGYERSGYGPYLGTCVPIQPRHQQCGPGAVAPTAPAQGQCQCKASVIGPNCDRCAPNSFGLAPTNPQGCIPCFCSGVTQQCSASSYRRTSVSIDYARGDRDQLELTTSDSRQPYSPQTRAELSGQAIEFRSFEEARGQTLYWKLPEKFLGDKVTSYGGTLEYTFKFSGNGNSDQSADVILRGNDIALQYKHREPFYADRENKVQIKIIETSWQRVDGQQATREHLLMTLADLDTLLIKSTYNDDCTDSQLLSANLEFAEPYGQGLTAAEVEQCICPPGYVGTSCEDCAPGYSRTGGGLYLGLCEKCECNGHASQCDKEYGYCLDCQHNTEGDQCERCKPGFVGDARRGTPNDCQPEATRAPCHCNNHSPRGCDSFGRCLLCEHNTEGTHCERCKKGYYGDATKGSPYDCTPCPCPGASDCYLDNEGQVACRICPAGLQGRLCNECAPGYTRSNKPAGRVCEPIGQVTNEDITFVQKPHEVLRVRIMEPKRQIALPGDRVHWICQVTGYTTEKIHVEWTKVGEMSLPPNAKAYDGYLVLKGVEAENAGQYRCTATTITQYATDDALLTISKRISGRPPQPVIDPPHLVVNEGEPAAFRCWVPGIPDCQITWHREQLGGPLPHGVYQTGNALKIPQSQLHHAGRYICSAANQYGTGQSPPAVLEVKKPVIPPKVDPIRQTVDRDQPARFKCWVPGNSNVQLRWSRPGGAPLPSGVQEQQGILHIPRASDQEVGQYVCTATDPSDNTPLQSEPVQLNIRDPAPPQRGAAPQIDPPNQTVNVNDPAQFRCWVPGQPRAQLKWSRKDGRPLPNGILERDGFLRIDKSQLHDAGEYECTSTEPDGSTQLSPPARLNVNQPQAIQPQVDPPVQTVNEGEPSRIRCWVPGHPNIQLQFVKRGRRPLPAHARFSQGNLEIPRTLKSDEDEYICIATDPTTNRPVESNPARVIVKSHQEPPTAVVEPRTWNGKPGERHQFRCITTGSPTPKITWTGPNGSPLPHDVTPLEPNILDFSNGRSELNGDYTCTASNPIGEASDHGNVNIGPSLTVKTNPPGPKLIVTVGEPLQVKCEAFGAPGDPEPEVEWLHDPGPERGDLPDDFKPVTISEQFIRHPNVGLGNAGVYTCKGSSAHATATKNIYIEVVEPSRIATVSILGGSSQWFDQGEKGELICTATGSSLVDRLEWEKVDDQLPTDVEEHNEPGLLHFPSFKNSYAGEYRCNGYRNNEIIASAAVHVHSSANADDEPKVEIEPPRVRVVSQGDNIVLKCSVQGAENGEHFKWALLRGGSLVRQLGTEPTLEITKADPSNDFGVYRCNVEDNNGLVIGSAFTAVSVGQQDKSHAQIVKFDDKSDASFTCPIYSVPGSKVDWTYENGDLPSKAVPNGNKIEIKEFDDASAGTYVCKVSFDGNVVEGFVTAQMFVPDTIIQVLLEVSSESPQIGDRAWFDCKVTGDPSAVISWTKEGNDDLPPNAQVTGGRLLFTDLKEDNAGVYRCVAKTKAGPLQTRTVLNVGSGKRKRKHLGNRRGRRLRHRRRNAQNGPLSRKTRTTTKLFGSWF
ncbi:Basement membrane proteoglycan [Caenorhabditis elegans]|uniref:Basement membrane proteoglycan n=1 Tax=Caenorhabditis elegans TaxID=6239 RepID=H9G353_CAEEL|nr:Basement membrane proteoglycan [Caenorhabditis elegans]CCG28431.1 Basement membrane proteoglycan [Caenorhabditis elegans]|eukprot:NP_001254442.1 Basement membrane proteoglycan [Caenorhabditis elegans]